MSIWNRITRVFRGKDVGHVAVITLPEEMFNNGWYKFEMTTEGFNAKHEGKFTTFSGKVRVEMYEP